MSQFFVESSNSGPPPIIVTAYTPVTFSGITNSYTVLPTDYFISVDAQIPGTIYLPDSPTQNQVFEIKDRTGKASTNNITIRSLSGVTTVDLSTSIPMAGNFDAVLLLYHSGNYEII